jgi:hypothetical protein
MQNKKMRKLQQIAHRNNVDKTELANEFLSTLKNKLAKRGYRADLALSTDAKSTAGTFQAMIAFDVNLGHPSERDIITIVAKNYPKHEIDWELAEVDSDAGIVALSLKRSTECIPIKNLQEIPPEFVAIGSGLYKRAVDSTVNEIWTLRRGEDGLILYRNHDDVEVKADDNQWKAGDVVKTSHGIGKIIRFTEDGNAFVQVGNNKHLVAGFELEPYKIEDEKKKIEDYYAQAYGDSEFARALVKDYDTVEDK